MKTISAFATTLVLALSTQSFAAAPAETPELLAKGKTSYTTNCLMCHGEKGDGNGPAGAVMKPKPRNFMTDAFKGADGKQKLTNPTVEQVRETIQKGVKGTTMVAYAHLSESDQYALAYYVLSLRKKK